MPAIKRKPVLRLDRPIREMTLVLRENSVPTDSVGLLGFRAPVRRQSSVRQHIQAVTADAVTDPYAIDPGP